MITLKNEIFKVLLVVAFSYFFAKFYLGMTDFVYALYSLTTISKFLPFLIVIIAFWILIGTSSYFSLMALRNVQVGFNFIILFLPMSALPFILLGVPQSALNHVFICRSSVVIFALMLVCSWFIQNALVRKYRLRFPFLLNILVFLLLYSTHLFSVEEALRPGVLEACFVLIVVAMFFYFVISWAHDYETIKAILKIMAVACLLQTVLSFLSYYYYVSFKGEKAYSFSGLLRDYELFAEYLAIHVPIVLFTIRNETSKFWKKIFTFGLVLMIFVLIATNIRGAILSLVAAMAYYFFNLRKISPVSQILKTVFVSVIICAVGLFAVYQLLPPSARIIERFLLTDLSTLDTRRYVWLAFYDYFVKKPMWGHGMFYDLPTSLLFWPHSTYFYYLLTIGIAGLANYLIFLLRIIGKGMKSMKIHAATPRYFELALTLNTALIIFTIDGLKVDYQRYSNYQLLIWTLFALVVAVNQIRPPAKKNPQNGQA